MALSAASNRSLLKCEATLSGRDIQSEMETETSCEAQALTLECSIPQNKIGKHAQENIFLIKIPKILRVFAQDVPCGMKAYLLWKRRLVNDLSLSAT